MRGINNSIARLLFLCSITIPAFAHANGANATEKAIAEFVPSGWVIEETVYGDLTGDSLDDVVLSLIEKPKKQGHEDEDRSRMLVVLMRQAGGAYEQIGVNKTLLLCDECFGAMGGGPEISMQKNVLVVDQLSGSRFTDQGIWRFRFDPEAHRMRLIGLDIKHLDRGNGSGTSGSTNYLTGKRITESYEYSEKKHQSVMIKSATTNVLTPKLYLEQATSESLQ